MVGGDAERIQDADALAHTLGAAPGSEVGELAFRIGDHDRSLIQKEVWNDDVSALALPACRRRSACGYRDGRR